MQEKGALVDFHLHSVYSDGSETIRDLIREAKERKIIAMALTDHNTGEGVPEFTKQCCQNGIFPLEGVEIYVAFPDEKWAWDNQYCGPVPDCVILGKHLNWSRFEEGYKRPLMRYWANIWLPETLRKLKAKGFVVPQLSKGEIQKQVEMGVPPVLHEIPQNPKNWSRIVEIARENGVNITVEEVAQNPIRFGNRYLYAIGMPGYVLRGPESFTVDAAVALAKDMGGILIAAHPGGEYGMWSSQHLEFFVAMGGKGIEVFQYFHSSQQIEFFLNFARQYNLIVSGGSDYHGKNGPFKIACWDRPSAQTPLWVLTQLLENLP